MRCAWYECNWRWFHVHSINMQSEWIRCWKSCINEIFVNSVLSLLAFWGPIKKCAATWRWLVIMALKWMGTRAIYEIETAMKTLLVIDIFSHSTRLLMSTIFKWKRFYWYRKLFIFFFCIQTNLVLILMVPFAFTNKSVNDENDFYEVQFESP